MDYKLIIGIWFVLAASIIYWDMQRFDEPSPIYSKSTCHNSEIKMMNNRPMCTECKLYCEIKK